MTERNADEIRAFIERLSKLGAADRARLKRDAGRPLAEAQSLGLFYRLLPYGLSPRQEEIYFMVATLYPLADGGGGGNLGASLHRARDPKNCKGLDRRIEVLLDADLAHLPFRLRQTVRMLKSQRVKINWAQLLEDLLRWQWPSRTVQKQWARAYFALPEPPSKDDSPIAQQA